MFFSRNAILVMFFCIAALAALLLGTSDNHNICDRCNVIIISIDSLRADHLGVNGYSRDTTPNIDAFAKDAVNFTNYFSAAYLTPMSAMSAHTGRYPWNNGVINFQSYLRDGVHTLAEYLADEGYATAAFGSSPEFTIHSVLQNDFSRGFEHYVINADRSSEPWQEAQEWVAKQEAPFFLWIPLGAVHWPYGKDAPRVFTDPAYKGPFQNALLNLATLQYVYGGTLFAPSQEEFSAFYKDFYGVLPAAYPYPAADARKQIPLSEADFQYVVDRYDDGIQKIDRQIGEFLAWLHTRGIDRNTIIIIDSEHGEEFGEHGIIGHYDVTEATTHVPLILRIPGVAARTVSSLASNIDLMPSILAAVGVSLPQSDGGSMLPLMTGATSTFRDAIFTTRTPLWERLLATHNPNTIFARFRAVDDTAHYRDYAIRTREWMLVHRSAREGEFRYSIARLVGTVPKLRNEFELYDIVHDPDELYNVASEHPDVVSALAKQLTEWEQTLDAKPLPDFEDDHQEYF